jgi:hypothetical protein
MSDECGIGATALGIRLRTTPTCRSRRQILVKRLPPYSLKRLLLNNTEAAGDVWFFHLMQGLTPEAL